MGFTRETNPSLLCESPVFLQSIHLLHLPQCDFVALYTTFVLCSRHYRPLLVLHLHTRVYFTNLDKAKYDTDAVSSSISVVLLHALA